MIDRRIVGKPRSENSAVFIREKGKEFTPIRRRVYPQGIPGLQLGVTCCASSGASQRNTISVSTKSL
jgi:hypothetical protein